MPVNRNALIRYRTIDNCLRNRYRKWTLEDLVSACSDALYEYEGIDKGVSKRSVQMDIQLMRSDKLGYNAPITVVDRKYYIYDDPDYSITNIPLTDQDLGKLSEVVDILRQFKGFSHFQELSGMVQRLENKIHSARTNQEPVIDFEKNEHLKGLEFIDALYQAIINKCAVTLTYQSFRARSANTFAFHPYYLKEYRNRWFVLGIRKKNSPILNLALDRIVELKECGVTYVPKSKDLNLPSFFNDIIGVTVNPGAKTERILLFADSATAPYIETKPIHHTQKLEEVLPNGTVFSLQVQVNFELEREILGFGARVRVLAPGNLKRRIKECLSHALDQYQYEFSDGALQGIIHKLDYKGFAIINHVYTKKEVNQIKSRIETFVRERGLGNVHALRNVLSEIPELKAIVLNTNLRRVLKKIKPDALLTKALYFDKSPDANWYVTWHQNTTINVKKKVDTKGFTGWTKKAGGYGVRPPREYLRDTVTIRIHLDDAEEANGALRVIPGSHNNRMTDDEIALVVQNTIPVVCEVPACGVHLMKPLLLHASSKAVNQRHRRVLHLEFNSLPLPENLEWAECEHVERV
jgi:predicted DNA-binding transcriptional regulator YafY